MAKKKGKSNDEQEVLDQETVESEETAEETEVQEAETAEAEENPMQAKYDELYDKHLRTLAEYDNYKRRTQKEKDAIYLTAQMDAIETLLPVLDNLERAVEAAEDSPMKEGVQMIVKQLLETLAKLGVSEIEAVGKTFDPNVHNAVMHIEDDSVEENVIVEQFAKGYMMKDKVIRHSMVKVAN
ncbi:MAG: nucleotide exchange factor GrpE [Ruminococcaceae bacterium]|nr:nucleotide exchange factor GrpE [Oscillospiraceae bacterium]